MAVNNSQVKEFDISLGNYINSQIAEGIDISTVVLVLDKYLLSAKMAEMEVIEQEKEAERVRVGQEANMNAIAPEEECDCDAVNPVTTATAEPAVDVIECDSEEVVPVDLM